MIKYCSTCKQIRECYYCAKYGNKGIYMQLEKILSTKNKKDRQIPTVDIHKIQLARFTKD